MEEFEDPSTAQGPCTAFCFISSRRGSNFSISALSFCLESEEYVQMGAAFGGIMYMDSCALFGVIPCYYEIYIYNIIGNIWRGTEGCKK